MYMAFLSMLFINAPSSHFINPTLSIIDSLPPFRTTQLSRLTPGKFQTGSSEDFLPQAFIGNDADNDGKVTVL